MDNNIPSRRTRKREEQRYISRDSYGENRGRKSRPKTRKSPLPMILGIFFLVLVIAGGVGFFMISSGLKGGSGGGSPVTVVVEPGSNLKTIARLLEDEGVITDSFYFRLAAKQSGQDGSLKPGTYELETDMPHKELLAILEKGQQAESMRVTIREGLTVAQTAAVVAEATGLSAEEFVAQAKASNYVGTYPFLAGSFEDSLEGYLFPNTYDFALGASVNDVIERMLKQYVAVWDGIGAPSGQAAAHNLSQHELMTVASLIEKETKIANERELVSSVIYNRLNKDMKLQLCSSVQFLLPDGDQRNKLRLTNADIATPSPFNTYLHEGLPPRPIANPGKAAIEAALNPAHGEYLYFVLTGKDGSQTFATNQADFAKAKAKSKEVFGK